MLNIIISKDCGNSPKNLFLQRFVIALAKRDTEYIMRIVTDDVYWHRINEAKVHGKASLVETLNRVRSMDEMDELNILHAISHGRAGAVDGILKFQDGKKHAFCHVIEFNNSKGALVKQMTSYSLVLDNL